MGEGSSHVEDASWQAKRGKIGNQGKGWGNNIEHCGILSILFLLTSTFVILCFERFVITLEATI